MTNLGRFLLCFILLAISIFSINAIPKEVYALMALFNLAIGIVIGLVIFNK